MEIKSEEWYEGYSGCRHAAMFEDCPYIEGSRACVDWCEGFYAALDEINE